ncbi:sugar phosphate isomerase/epimerase family protein [Pseudomonas monteilii]
MHHPIYAMDFIFQTNLGTYSLQAQCEMLSELGYQGLKVSSWSSELEYLAKVQSSWALEVGAVYAIYRPGFESRLIALAESLEGCQCIQLALHSGTSITEGDVRMIETLLPICERRGIQIALYPHVRYGMQTTSEAVKLCKMFDHSNLGIVFNGYHWYAAKEGSLEDRLDALWPWLKDVIIAGSSTSPLGWGGIATIEPLDSGEVDNFVILGALRRRGYTGNIAFLGWEGMGGNVYNNLRRSRDAFREMELRYEAHPDWSLML